ncbi:Gfo/Idh/MocA family oxidoreductase, partial [Myxococcota bacterium]|nr:Gfo/Idh/MocA family oxidoreductase [Myxococcota bacterium]
MPQTPPPLRGVIVGYGHMGRLHGRRLRERADAVLAGVIDPLRPEGEDVLWGPSLDALGELGPLHFAIVAAPSAAHAPLAEALLDRGLAVLVEKPLTPSAAEAARLVGAPRLSVSHLERYNPTLRALPQGTPPRYLRAERLAPPRARGLDVDVILDLMIHDIDLALWLGGGAPVRALQAVGVSVRGGALDIAEAWIELEGGFTATLTASRVSRAAARRLRVVNDGEYFSLDLNARRAERVPWGQGDLDAQPIEVPPGDSITALHDAFMAAIRGEAPFP